MNQSEIWLINLEPAVGSEIKKTRPCIIVNDNDLGTLPLKVIVPLTDWKDRFSKVSWMIKITPDKNNKLSKVSAADCFQVRSVQKNVLLKNLVLLKLT